MADSNIRSRVEKYKGNAVVNALNERPERSITKICMFLFSARFEPSGFANPIRCDGAFHPLPFTVLYCTELAMSGHGKERRERGSFLYKANHGDRVQLGIIEWLPKE